MRVIAGYPPVGGFGVCRWVAKRIGKKRYDLKVKIASIKTSFNLKKIIYRAGCHLGPPGLGGSAGVGLMVRATAVVWCECCG